MRAVKHVGCSPRLFTNENSTTYSIIRNDRIISNERFAPERGWTVSPVRITVNRREASSFIDIPVYRRIRKLIGSKKSREIHEKNVINWLSSTQLELEYAQVFPTCNRQVLYYAKYHRFEKCERQTYLIKQLSIQFSGIESATIRARVRRREVDYRPPIYLANVYLSIYREQSRSFALVPRIKLSIIFQTTTRRREYRAEPH